MTPHHKKTVLRTYVHGDVLFFRPKDAILLGNRLEQAFLV